TRATKADPSAGTSCWLSRRCETRSKGSPQGRSSSCRIRSDPVDLDHRSTLLAFAPADEEGQHHQQRDGDTRQHGGVLSRLPRLVESSLDLSRLGFDVAWLDLHCLLILHATSPAPTPATTVVIPRAATLYHSLSFIRSAMSVCIPA